MAASYFPRSDAGLVVWITNLLTALPAQAKALGMSPTEYKDAIDQAKAVVATAVWARPLPPQPPRSSPLPKFPAAPGGPGHAAERKEAV